MGRLFDYSYPLSELYDAWHPDRSALPKAWGDDRELYAELAGELGQPVLELGIGTGRVARHLAWQGFDVVGLDLSSAMIARARTNMGELSPGLRGRITIVEGDMRSFDLGTTFPLAICPFTAFQHLLTVEDQVSALQCVRGHLSSSGHFVLDLFDPRLELCAPSAGAVPRSHQIVHPTTGRAWLVVEECRRNVPEEQVLHADWRFVELDESGKVLAQFHDRLTLRWSYRFEVQHLLERCGFTVVNLWSDYRRSSFAYGQRQVWLVRKA